MIVAKKLLTVNNKNSLVKIGKSIFNSYIDGKVHIFHFIDSKRPKRLVNRDIIATESVANKVNFIVHAEWEDLPYYPYSFIMEINNALNKLSEMNSYDGLVLYFDKEILSKQVKTINNCVESLLSVKHSFLYYNNNFDR